MPEINVHRPGTKVNVWIIAGIVLFLLVGAGAAIWISHRPTTPPSAPRQVADDTPGKNP